MRSKAVVYILIVLLGTSCPRAVSAALIDREAAVDLSAESLVHDQEKQIIVAEGEVELVQEGRILRADRIVYDLAKDEVVASGNIILNETNGDVHFADELALGNEMKDGFVRGLRSLLADGSRFTAESGERIGGTKIIMYDASYTPCEVCDKNPDKPPVWQLTANKVTYHEDENRISYNNARFELFGTPIAWTPYFSHPDGTIKQKTGLLTPHFGYDSELGLVVDNRYYWALAPHKDVTLGTMILTKEKPVIIGEYRYRWADAAAGLSGSITESGREDSVAGIGVSKKDETRGHVSGEGLWNIDERWRSGFNLDIASDDQYLRQYDFSNEDVLTNELYIERFSGRDYAAGRMLAFQDLRVREEKVEDQPNVLPEVVASFYGEPSRTLGGRWHVEASALGLHREGSGQDVSRAVLAADWQRRLVSDTGLVTTVTLSGRGDAYNIRDREEAASSSSQAGNSETETRAFAQAHVVSAYPMAKPIRNAQILIEPKVAVTAAPKIDIDPDIPNEDSKDVQIDASNIFQSNRFPGLDRIEDGSRATYGIKTGVYGHEGSHADVFVGQSFRFDDDNNPFPKGSGLSERESDIVGQVSARYKNRFGTDYRFQISSEQFTSQRHEVDAYARWRRLDLNAQYLHASALEGTEINDSREQIKGWGGYFLTNEWRVRGLIMQDLGMDHGLRKAEMGLDYIGQCIGVSGTYTRELTSDTTGDSGTKVMFRVSLKNLGELRTPGISLDNLIEDNEAIDGAAR